MVVLQRIVIVFGLMMVIAGCEITPDCQVKDWYHAGLESGQAGESVQQLAELESQCGIEVDNTDRAKWIVGNKQGVNHYCSVKQQAFRGYTDLHDTGICQDQQWISFYRLFLKS